MTGAIETSNTTTAVDPPAAKTDFEQPSSVAETDATDENHEKPLVVDDLHTIKNKLPNNKWLSAFLCIVVLVTLSAIVFSFFAGDSAALSNNDLPVSNTSLAEEESKWNHSQDDRGVAGDAHDDLVLIPSISINNDDEDPTTIDEEPIKIDIEDHNRSEYVLVDSRQSLNNFDFDANTFMQQMQTIEPDNRIYVQDFFIQQQLDGNLVLYDQQNRVYWNSGVVHPLNNGKRYWTVLQDDGNMVTYSRFHNRDAVVEWASNSFSNIDNYNLVLTPNRDGLMIVRRNNGQIIWSTVYVSAGIPNPPNNNGGITYTPGKLNRRENGLLLSEGLRSRIVAQSGEKVVLDGRGNGRSHDLFHHEPDGAAVFENFDNGGWVYVSNSEVKEPRGRGGVGAIYFDQHARTTDYRMIQRGTTANCSGGKTPWNTWVSCEETDDGRTLQIDPWGRRGMQEMTMDRGAFEAFAFDIRDRNHPRFFVTEDHPRGALRRFSPSEKNWDDPWQLLHAPGTIQYLVLEPRGGGRGTFRWTTDKNYARQNAEMYYPLSEGIDVYDNQLFFTVKERKQLFILDLDRKTFERQSTRSGAFDGMPDQVKRIIGDGDGILYFCEESGGQNGVHGRNPNGWFFTILETDTFHDESTGLAFSPDGKRMYVSFQSTGKIYDIWREDGLPFHGQTLNIRYH